jgi:hypothetical protein
MQMCGTACAQRAELSQSAARSATTRCWPAARTVGLAAPARVGRDVLLGSGSANIAAPVGRHVLAEANELVLSAPVGGDVRADADNLRLASGAAIAGGLSYTSSHEAEMATATSVGGPIQYQPRPTQPSSSAPAAWWTGGVVAESVRGLIGVLALGLVLVVVFPGFTGRVTGNLAASPWPSLAVGFGLLIATPIAAMLIFGFGLLVGGWWLGLIVLLLYGVCLVTGYVLAATAIGEWIFRRAGHADWHVAWALLAGLVLFGLIGIVPVLGGLVLLVALAAGLGAGALVVAQAYRAARAGRQETGAVQSTVASAATPA